MELLIYDTSLRMILVAKERKRDILCNSSDKYTRHISAKNIWHKAK